MNYKGAVETVSSKGFSTILVFSKGEEPGNVKTRLLPLLGKQGCLELHRAMLRDTLATCLQAAADVQLYHAGAPRFSFPLDLPLRKQVDGDLGARMREAFAENLSRYEKVLIVGTDAPGLTPPLLAEALEALQAHRLVLGPSLDGGYYLIGLTELLPAIFEGIPWSTADVLRLTVERAGHTGIHLLPSLYDVDLPEDLERLTRDIRSGSFPHARHLREWLKQSETNR